MSSDTRRWHAAGGGSQASTALSACVRNHPKTQEIDGIIMVIDPQHMEQEKELESFYMNFAQPHSLTIKQCLVVAVTVAKEGSYGLVGFNGACVDRGLGLASEGGGVSGLAA